MDFLLDSDRIYALDAQGALVAEITFPSRDGAPDVDHTFVDDSLRGQGVAGQLVEAAARELRRRGAKAGITCAYAKTWFAQHPEYSDVLR